MSDVVLDVRGLEHGFGADSVLTGVDLTLRHGEFLVLLGASGCGKTTLLRSIAGLVTPRHGRIEISGRLAAEDGRDKLRPEERGVGLVFQDYALFPALDVRSNLGFGLSSDPSGRVDALLESFELTALARRFPSELSGGQQQRVALARALAPQPRILLLDEPFANVDAGLREQLAVELKAAVRDEGTSVVLVTHDRREALALADRVAVLGRCGNAAGILECAPPEQIYRRPSSRQVAELVGPASFIESSCTGSVANTRLGSLSVDPEHTGPVELLVRPDDLEFYPEPEGICRVTARLFQGGAYRYCLDTPAGEILVDATERIDVDTRGRVRNRRPCWPLPESHSDS